MAPHWSNVAKVLAIISATVALIVLLETQLTPAIMNGSSLVCEQRLQDSPHPRSPFADALLVVNFNYHNLAHTIIPKYLSLYQSFFPNIVFLSNGPLSTVTFNGSQMGPADNSGLTELAPGLWYYYSKQPPGYKPYNCGGAQVGLMQVIEALPLFSGGYIYTNDDVVLNPWRLADLPRSTFWLPRESCRDRANNGDFDLSRLSTIDHLEGTPDLWWDGFEAQKACQNFWADPEFPANVRTRLEAMMGAGKKICWQAFSDFAFVPGDPKILPAWFNLTRLIAQKHNVMMEVSFPTTSRMLFHTDVAGISFINAVYIWDKRRTLPIFEKHIGFDTHVAHALKLSDSDIFGFVQGYLANASRFFSEIGTIHKKNNRSLQHALGREKVYE